MSVKVNPLLPNSRNEIVKALLGYTAPRKPWWKRLQFFWPWSSVYLGVQWDNRFIGRRVRYPKCF